MAAWDARSETRSRPRTSEASSISEILTYSAKPFISLIRGPQSTLSGQAFWSICSMVTRRLSWSSRVSRKASVAAGRCQRAQAAIGSGRRVLGRKRLERPASAPWHARAAFSQVLLAGLARLANLAAGAREFVSSPMLSGDHCCGHMDGPMRSLRPYSCGAFLASSNFSIARPMASPISR